MRTLLETITFRRPYRHESVTFYASIIGGAIAVVFFDRPPMWFGVTLVAGAVVWNAGWHAGWGAGQKSLVIAYEREALQVLVPTLVHVIEEIDGRAPEVVLTEMRTDLIRMRSRLQDLEGK